MKEKQLHIIHRYLNNEIELKEVKASMSADEFNAWKETLDLSNDLPDVDFDVEKEYNLLQSRKEQVFSKHKPTGFRYLKIAAVFIALIASTFFIAKLRRSIASIIFNFAIFYITPLSLILLL